MSNPIYMRVGEGNTLDLPDLIGAMDNFWGLLREVDSTIAQRKTGNLRWKVTTLRREPFPLVGVTPLLRPSISKDDTSEQVEREVVQNVRSLTEKGERTRYFSDAALTKVVRIAASSPKIGASSIYTEPSRGFSLSTTVNVSTLKQVKELTSIQSTAYGSVVGSLDSISVHRGKKEFRVWDESIGRPVRCRFSSQQERMAKDLLGHRVVVTGMISGDRVGRPVSMGVETLDGAELQGLPTIEEMKGLIPDFTGGLSLKEFFEDMD